MKGMIAGVVVLAAVFVCGMAQTGSNDKEEVQSKLDNRITLSVKDKPFDEVITEIREKSNINIMVDPKAKDKLVEVGENVTVKLENVKIRSALKLILGQKSLAGVYRGGSIVIITKEELKKKVTVKIYYVSDLLMPIRDFTDAKLMPLSTGSGSGGGGFGEGGGAITGATFQIDEEPKEQKMEDTLIVNMVKNNTGGDSWTENEENTSIDIKNGMLIVSQTPKVHVEIDKMLKVMRMMR